MSSLDTPQKGRTKKATDHRASPIERNKSRGGLRGETCNFGQAEIIHQKTSYRNLRAHIRKNSNCAQEKVTMLPDRTFDLLSGTVRGSLDFGKLESADQNRQQHQGDADHRVWHLVRGRFLHAVRMQHWRRQLP